MEIKRYSVVTSFYIEAENEQQAIDKAKHKAAQQDTKNDDGCSVDGIFTAEWGQLERKQIYPIKK